jgi:hypothetical protein
MEHKRRKATNASIQIGLIAILAMALIGLAGLVFGAW